MTVVLIGLDALDSRLVSGHKNIELSSGKRIETFAKMKDVPFTLEVWPSVATGKMPQQHGITEEGTSSWDNILIDILSNFTGNLPDGKRNQLGRMAEKYFGAEYTIPETNEQTLFDKDGRVVHNWPGVYRNRYLLDVWRTLNPGEQNQSPEEFEREIKGIASEQFGWVEEMIEHDVSLVATHIHTIDMAGHIYFRDRDRYESIYNWVDKRIGDVLEKMDEGDEIVILSDHGMDVEWLEDENPGVHNWNPYCSTTIDKGIFDEVTELRGWIEPEIEDIEEQDSENIEYDEEQLRDLGYIE